MHVIKAYMLYQAKHAEFNSEAQSTWRVFFQAFFRDIHRFESLLHPYYRDHVALLERFSGKIPGLAELDELLAPIGWSTRYVEGYIPSWMVARLLRDQVMPISSSIRPLEQVFFAREPDLIHDIFGHLPSLFNSDYRKLLALWADAACSAPIVAADRTQYHLNKLIVQSHGNVSEQVLQGLTSANAALAAYMSELPSSLHILDRLYFWIFEFGLVKHDTNFSILGAGILSSLSELEKLANYGPLVSRRISDQSILGSYHISSEQSGYLIADNEDDFETLLLLQQEGLHGTVLH